MPPQIPALAGVVAFCLLLAPSSGRCQSSASGVVVLGLPDDHIKIDAPGPRLRMVFRLEARDDSARSVRLDVPALVDKQGIEHPVTVRSGTRQAQDTLTVSVPALGYATVGLEAELTASGEHRSSISLVIGRRRTTQLLTVTRVLGPSPVVIGLRPASTVVRSGKPTSVWVTLRDTSGMGATVRRPIVVDLHRLADTLGAEYRQVQVLDEDGRPVNGLLTLTPDSGVRRLKISFDGLTSPGNYAGTISVPGVGTRSVDAALTLAARRGWWIAALLILLGVAVSAGIRYLAGPLRTRKVQRATSAHLRERIHALSESLGRSGPLSEEEEAVLRRWRERLQLAFAPEAAVGGQDPDVLVNELFEKIELFGPWVNSRRAVDALMPAHLQIALRAKVASVGVYLNSNSANVAKHAEAASVLESIPSEIVNAQKQNARKLVDELAAEVQRTRELRAGDAELTRALHEFVLTPLSRVGAELEQEMPDFVLVASTLDGVRWEFARLLARTLTAELTNAEKPPYYDGDWASLHSTVLAQLSGVETASTAGDAMKQYSAAQETYLSSVLDEMTKDTGRRRAQLRALGPIASQVLQDLGMLDAERGVVLKQVVLGDVHRAAGSFVALESKYLVLLDEIVRITGGGTLGRNQETSTGSMLGLGVPDGVVGTLRIDVSSPGPRVIKRERTAAEIMTDIRRLDGILTLVGALIATVLGVWLLYAGRATWGSMQDCLAAVLWGLGLHGVTANAGAGIQDVLGRIRNPADTRSG